MNEFSLGQVGGKWWEELDRLQVKLLALENQLSNYQDNNNYHLFHNYIYNIFHH